MKLSEYSKYRTTRDRAEAILHVLEGLPGKTLHDDRGKCTETLLKMLPRHLQMQKSTNKVMSVGSFSSVLKDMEQAGFIMTEVNGRRTYNIFLVSLPDDWDEYRTVDHSHVPEPMVMPVTVTADTMPRLPDSVAEKLGRPVPITTDKMREVIREEMTTILNEWWSSLK